MGPSLKTVLGPARIALAIVVVLSAVGIAPSAAHPLTQVEPGGIVSDWAAVPDGAVAHAVPSNRSLNLTVTLAPRDGAVLSALDRAITDRENPLYRHFLTEAAFEARFAPTPDSLAKLESYFGGFGAHSFDPTADRTAVTFMIPVEGAGSALRTTFAAWVGSDGRSTFSAAFAPRLPVEIASLVTGISGLSGGAAGSTVATVHPGIAGPVTRAGGPGQFVNDSRSGTSWYFGSDYAQAYGVDRSFPPSPVSNATFPVGEAVATILMSGYNQTFHVNLPPFDPAVVAQYYNDTFPVAWPHPTIVGVPVALSGVTPPSPRAYGNLRDSSLNELENSLDLEMAGSLAPGSMVVNFYFGASLYMGPSGSLSNGAAADDFARTLSAALTYNYGSHRLDAITNSFGLPDLNDTLWNTELLHAAVVGVTVVASSGDQGNAPAALTNRFQGQWPSWPATAAFDNFGTLAVGGSSLTLGGRAVGTFQGGGQTLPSGYDSNLSGVVDQSAWYTTVSGPGNYSGSEGGVTPLYAEPAWQFHSAAQPAISNATGTQGVGQLGRSEPDVALAANATIVYASAVRTSVFFEVVDGTSISSPVLAGIIADWSAVLRHPIGYIAPELYRMASYYAAHPGPANPFQDVVNGANFVFSAGPGWDAVTGWGGLNASAFLTADANRSISGFQYGGPTPGVPLPRKVPVVTNGNPVWLVVAGVILASVVVLVIYLGRSKPVARSPYDVPTGAFGPTAPDPGSPPYYLPPPPPSGSYYPPPPAAFLCPYCGTSRPAEPVRCPGCGAL